MLDELTISVAIVRSSEYQNGWKAEVQGDGRTHVQQQLPLFGTRSCTGNFSQLAPGLKTAVPDSRPKWIVRFDTFKRALPQYILLEFDAAHAIGLW